MSDIDLTRIPDAITYLNSHLPRQYKAKAHKVGIVINWSLHPTSYPHTYLEKEIIEERGQRVLDLYIYWILEICAHQTRSRLINKTKTDRELFEAGWPIEKITKFRTVV